MQVQFGKRNPRGQSLIGGTCGVILIAMFFSLLAAFSVNSFVYGSIRAKLQVAANEAAGKVNRNINWNGAERPHFQKRQTARIKHDTVEFTKAICEELGLNPAHITVTVDSAGENGSSQVTLALSHLNLPYAIAGMFPGVATVEATGISTDGSEPPPAFIRLGYNLDKDDSINTSNTTDITQVCLLPSYGFETDLRTGSGGPGIDGTDTNADVVANQPDDKYCAWNALNVDFNKEGGEQRARFKGRAPRKKNYSGSGYESFFPE
jgi:hypothetical protein